jgi:hypothetical protein
VIRRSLRPPLRRASGAAHVGELPDVEARNAEAELARARWSTGRA